MSLPDSLTIVPREEPIEALVRPPGSKSLTNRALVVASLAAEGVSRLEGALDADDTRVMRTALRDLGVMIDDVDDPWLVLGTADDLTPPPGVIDVGASGTTARFVTAVCALLPGPVSLDGTERMRERPIAELADALRQLGARVETKDGSLPVSVAGGELRGGEVSVDVARSSQFLSAVLMISPLVGEEVVIRPIGGEVVSRPYVTSTLDVMRAFGAEVGEDKRSFRVAPTGYHKAEYAVEADASAAAYPLVAAAICGGLVGIEGIPLDSTQADLRLVEVLEEMGCEVMRQPNRLVLAGPSRKLKGVDVDMSQAPDAALALAVACLFAAAPSRLRNLGTLRLKETDRLAALETELRRVGAMAVVEGADLVIEPGTLRPARIETYDDHRMAMAFSLVGLRQSGIEIVDPACVTKTWPGFFSMLEAL